MIKNLFIQNFVLIQNLALDFHNGFSAFTGETGAGKSILIDAISMLCGNRANGSYVSHGKEKAIIEGTFDLSNDREAVTLLEESGFDINAEEVTFTREIQANGKSTVRIDHRIATLSLLRECLHNQIDIHGQRDNSYLLDTANHLHLLDEFLKDGPQLIEVRKKYQNYRELLNEKKKLETETFNEDDLEYYRYQMKEIEDADLKIGEDEQLEEKEKAYQSVRDSYEKMNHIFELYDESASDAMYQITKTASLLGGGEKIEHITSALNEAYYNFDDAIDSLKKLKDEMDLSDEEINEMEERLFEIQKMKRKYGHSISDILAKKDELQELVDSFVNRSRYLEEIDHKIFKAREEYDEAAEKLSKKRKENAHLLDEAISQHLKDLLLPNCQFRTVFTDHKDPSADGNETCEFHISMNKGETIKPLSKTASGGEISRLMLGLKAIFTSLQGIQTVIFDEIDTGVSGPVATAIGRKMKALSKNVQVFSVTHLAQVAACADYNYFVSKSDDADTTHTQVVLLNEEQTIQELAMISSGAVTDTSIKAAKELYERNHQK